jgi:hypothetical protein
MAVELVNASAVVVGHDVNLSIFRPPWLRDQKILSDEELAGDVVITPPMVRIPAPSFELLILPDRVQVRPSDDPGKAQSDILRVLGGIVSTLPHTPFTAIGLNFDYLTTPDEHTEFQSWNKERFAAPFSVGVIGSAQGEARFGAYCSFDTLGMRLKADLKPVRRTEQPEGGILKSSAGPEAMLGKFNFHRDLKERPAVSEILQVLGRWADAASLALTMAESACVRRGQG